MVLSKRTKIILLITSLIVVLIVSISLIIYLSNKKTPEPEPEPSPTHNKQNIGDVPMFDVYEYYTMNKENNGSTPDITSNTIKNVNLTKLLYLCSQNIENINTWGDINNNNCSLQIQIYQNTDKYNYTYYITYIDVGNKTLTFDAPIHFNLSSKQAWPLDIQIGKGYKYVKAINY